MGAAVLIEEEAIPLSACIEQSNGESQAHGDVAPDAMGGFLGVADQGEHRVKVVSTSMRSFQTPRGHTVKLGGFPSL